MAKTNSAKKAIRKEKKRRIKNLEYKNKIKSLAKKAKKLVEEKKPEEAQKIVPMFYKSVDKAVKIGIIKKNTGARKKAQIAKLTNNK